MLICFAYAAVRQQFLLFQCSLFANFELMLLYFRILFDVYFRIMIVSIVSYLN